MIAKHLVGVNKVRIVSNYKTHESQYYNFNVRIMSILGFPTPLSDIKNLRKLTKKQLVLVCMDSNQVKSIKF